MEEVGCVEAPRWSRAQREAPECPQVWILSCCISYVELSLCNIVLYAQKSSSLAPLRRL